MTFFVFGFGSFLYCFYSKKVIIKLVKKIPNLPRASCGKKNRALRGLGSIFDERASRNQLEMFSSRTGTVLSGRYRERESPPFGDHSLQLSLQKHQILLDLPNLLPNGALRD